jgi:AcrR family transcriptional regulator
MAEGNGSPGTRDRILIAAAAMLDEDPTGRLSVRGVAARAGVSTGSLRHFFPTQEALIDAVVAGLAGVEVPGDPILDRQREPGERLEACMQLMLDQLGTGERVRASWRKTYEVYLEASPPRTEGSAYSALEQLGMQRIERWLRVLADDGVLPVSGIAERARFLATVLNGVYLERALPADRAAQQRFEATTIRMAVEAVLRQAPA